MQGFGLFGDGSDGNATIAAFGLNNNVTTLLADSFFNNLNIASGAQLNTGGFRLFVLNNLTIDTSGILAHNGQKGGDGTTAGGSAQLRATAGAGATAGTLGGGASGGHGGITGGAGLNLVTFPFIGRGGMGGRGGAGAGKSGGFGGMTLDVSSQSLRTGPRYLTAVMQGFSWDFRQSASGPAFFMGGGGGGGGDGYTGMGVGSGAVGLGGGGGGGGGFMMVAAQNIINAGQIQANGGTGGMGASVGAAISTSGLMNAGGGGGGGGGLLVIVRETSTGVGTAYATGGAGGSGCTNVVNGSLGTPGRVIEFILG